MVSTTSGATTTSYTYDGDGNRLQTSTGSQASQKTNYVWDANESLPQLAIERDGNSALLRRYVYGQHRISLTDGTSIHYFTAHDRLGSVANVTSSTGASEWTYDYEPFGALRTENQDDPNAPVNPMKFTGELADLTGLYYLRARQYDPNIGRFLQVDAAPFDRLVPSISGYQYVANQPTVNVDPSGMKAEPSGEGAAMARRIASSVGTARASGPPWFCGLLQDNPYFDRGHHVVKADGYLDCSGPRAAQLYMALQVCVGRKIRRRFWFDTWNIHCNYSPGLFVHKRSLKVTGILQCKRGTHEYQGVGTGHVKDPAYGDEIFTIGPVRSPDELTDITC